MKIGVIFWSRRFGQGKTVAALSYTKPGADETRRLVLDGEERADRYYGEKDDPDTLRFAFDKIELPKTALEIVEEILECVGDYDVVVFDNATWFQNQLVAFASSKDSATKLAKLLGIEAQSRTFLKYRFNPTTPAYYKLIKDAIGELLRRILRSGASFIATAEAKNVWRNYGTRDQRIVGQTAKLLDPWFQFADVVLELTRNVETDGTITVQAAPVAQLDPLNPKCSLPGLPAKFTFDNWDAFWKPVTERKPASDFSGVESHIEIVEPEQPVVAAFTTWENWGDIARWIKEHGGDIEEAKALLKEKTGPFNIENAYTYYEILCEHLGIE